MTVFFPHPSFTWEQRMVLPVLAKCGASMAANSEKSHSPFLPSVRGVRDGALSYLRRAWTSAKPVLVLPIFTPWSTCPPQSMTRNATESGVMKDILRGHACAEVISTPHLSVNCSAGHADTHICDCVNAFSPWTLELCFTHNSVDAIHF